MSHVCFGTVSEEDLYIHKAESCEYWIMEWNTEDENDPCYGNMTIQYCPFCGVGLRTLN